MQYYSLNHATGPEIGKTYPQSQELHEQVRRTEPHHLKNQRAGSIWPENTYIPSPVLDKKAKRTDLISSTSVFSSRLVISNKMKEILQQFRQTGLQFFKTQLIDPLPGNKVHNLAMVTDSYWVVNFFETDYKYLDFQQSEVNLVGIGGVKVKTLDIKTVWDFYEAEKELTTIWIDKMVLLQDIREHLLHIPRVKSGPYLVSEVIKEALEKAGCTGIQFEPLEHPPDQER